MKLTSNRSAALRIVATLAVAATTFSGIGAAPALGADATPVQTITGNTSSGENVPGWNFGRDAANQTAFWFTQDVNGIGKGSLYVAPITNKYIGNSDKFAAELFLAESANNKGISLSDLSSLAFDYKWVAGNGYSWTGKAAQVYMNVYVNYATSTWDNYYDCRYDVVATTGSTGAFTTLTFSPSVAATAVRTRTGSAACPVSKKAADISGGGFVRAIAINVGDTTISDTGLGAYLDNVVLTGKASATYDFEESAIVIDGIGTGVLDSQSTLSVTGGNSSAQPTFSAEGSDACAVDGSTLTITSATGKCEVTSTKATLGGWSAQSSVKIVPLATSLTLSVDSALPAATILTATVVPAEAEGTVTTTEGLTCTLQMGVCQLDIKGLTSGYRNIEAQYSGSKYYAASSSTLDNVLIDSTGPALEGVTLSTSIAAPGTRIVLSAQATDGYTSIASANYRIAGGTWTRMLAADGALDSLSEGLRANIVTPSGDALNVTIDLEATDVMGNVSQGTTTLLIEQPHPIITYTGPTAVLPGPTTITALITSPAGKAMAGEEMILSLTGERATTNKNGVATWTVQVSNTTTFTITHPIDSVYGAVTTGDITMKVLVETELGLAGPSSPVLRGASFSVSATVNPMTANLGFTFNKTVSYVSTTDGSATATFKAPTAKGTYSVVVTFAGDGTYAPATATISVTVK